MKYDVQFTNQFKKDLKLAKKQNKNLDKLFEVIEILANGGTLEAKYRDHDLTGNYKGVRKRNRSEGKRTGRRCLRQDRSVSGGGSHGADRIQE